MADQIMTAASELSAIVPEVWSARTYDVLRERLVFKDSIDDSYEGEIRNLGDTVHIHSIPQFDEANELAEGARNDADSVTVTDQQLQINRRIVKDFIVTNRAMTQSIEKMDKLRDLAAFSINKKMENLLIAGISPSTAAPDHDIPYDSGTTLALADILEAKELLDTQSVPEMDRQARLDSPQYNDLFNITGFTSKDFIPAGSPLTAGAITLPILGFEVNWSTLFANVSYFYHPAFLTVAIQEDMEVKEYDLGVDGKRAMRVNTDLLFGFKQLDDKRVVKIS